MADTLPPAVLELIVDAQAWIAGLGSAVSSLTEFDASMVEASAMVDDFSVALSTAIGEAAATMDEASASIIAGADSAAASLDALAASAAESAAAMDTSAASMKGVGAGAAESGGLLKTALGGVVGIAKDAAIGAAGVGIAAVTMAGDFQAATTRLVTSAGETNDNLDQVRQGLLTMAGQVGFTATQLAQGMYTVESAGYHGAAGLQVMQAAAQGAKDENADLGSVANAVTTIMKDYGLKAGDAATTTSQLVAAVSYGKTNLQDMSTAMANVLPIASSVGLKFGDVSAVMAEMTAHGTSAQKASQDVAAAIRSLEAPTTAMQKQFADFGISAQDVQQHLSQEGLGGTLEWLQQVAQQNANKMGETVPGAMKKLIGTAPGLQAMLETTGGSFADLQNAIQNVSGATADAQGNVQGFADVQQTLNFQFSQFKSQLETAAIALGNAMMPAVTALLKILDQLVTSLTSNNQLGDAFSSIVQSIGTAIEDLEPIISPTVSLFDDLVKILGSFLVDAIKIATPVISALERFLDDIFKAIEPLLPIFQQMADLIGRTLGDAADTLVEAFTPMLPQLTELAKTILTALFGVLKDLAPVFTDVVKLFADMAPQVADLLPPIVQLVKDLTPVFDLVVKLAALSLDSFVKAVSGVVTAVSNASKPVSDFITGILTLPDQVATAGGKVGSAFDGLAGHLKGSAGDAAKSVLTLNTLGYQPLIAHSVETTTRVTSLWTTTMAILGTTVGYYTGAIARYFYNMPSDINAALVEVQKWLATDGLNMMVSFYGGIAQGGETALEWFGNLPSNISNRLGDLQNWLARQGADLVEGLLFGSKNKQTDLYNFWINLPTNIIHWLGNPSTWLNPAGQSIVEGLWYGVLQKMAWLYNQIGVFVENVISAFHAAFNIHSPSKRMADEVGAHITTGIAQGMMNGMPAIHAAVDSIAGTVANAGSYGVGVNVAGLPRGLGAGLSGGGNQILVINNNVQGSVVSEQQLQQLNQTQTLRYNLRNPTNGLSLFGGRAG